MTHLTVIRELVRKLEDEGTELRLQAKAKAKALMYYSTQLSR